jgi:hypothetical protein
MTHPYSFVAVQHRVRNMSEADQRKLLEWLVKLLQVESIAPDGTVTYKPPTDNPPPITHAG